MNFDLERKDSAMFPFLSAHFVFLGCLRKGVEIMWSLRIQTLHDL